MSIDDKLRDFASRLDQQIEEHHKQQERDSAQLSDHAFPSVDKDRLGSQFHKESPADHQVTWQFPPRRGFPGAVQAQVDLSHDDALQRLDKIMWEEFALQDIFPGQPMSRYPVVYCETLEEFIAPMLSAIDCSPTEREKRLKRLVAKAREKAYGGKDVTFGYNLPGRGCFINGWLFGTVNDMTAYEALNDVRVLSDILETTYHEKLGHGFIAELTAMGEEKSDLGLWRFELAQDFPFRTVDSPRSSLLRQKHSSIQQTSRFLEEGWATWIAEHMVWQAERRGVFGNRTVTAQPQDRYSPDQVAQLLLSLCNQVSADERQIMHDLFKATQIVLAIAEQVAPEYVFWAMRVWQEGAHLLNDCFPQPAPYVLGYLLLRRLEARLGWQNVPCAVAIAANVTYNLEEISLVDLKDLVSGDPRLNVDARLALLGTLELAPEQGPAELARLAREELSLATPQGW